MRPWLFLTLLLPGAAYAELRPEDAGEPSLFAQRADGHHAFPLLHTQVDGQISGPLAGVTVTQSYQNPYSEPVQAVYVFPLPETAAVDDFEFRIGTVVIKGELKRREQARADYERARSEGKAAALLDQERPNIFTVSLANLLPGEKIEVRLHYVELLRYQNQGYSLAFPLTVGPRFNPGQVLSGEPQGLGSHPDTTQVTDASRISPPWVTEGRSGHQVDINFEIDSGVPLRQVTSPSHQIRVEPRGAGVTVRLEPQDRLPNKDFVLNLQTAGGELFTGVLATRDKTGPGSFLLVLQPKADADVNREVTPKEMVFVLDTSCSMSGQPIEQAKAVMRAAVRGMNPDDSFQILGFDDTVSSLSALPLPNTSENVAKGLTFIDGFVGGGGTMMNGGITAALAMPDDPKRMRMVFFMTDGYIGNESEIFGTIQRHLGNARVFSFGVGSSVNRHLIGGMAELGRGFSEVVLPASDPKTVADKFYERIRKPVLTDIEVSFSVPVHDLEPVKIPDLFESEPLVLTGRYEKGSDAELTVRGKVRGRPVQWRVRATFPEHDTTHAAIEKLWARRRIHRLEQENYPQRPEAVEAITELALEHRLMSQYTSFVAVHHQVRVDPNNPGNTILVPVELPEGVQPSAVGGELSRTEIPPGDPIISVKAPKDARRVTAYFPFGLTKALRWDPVTTSWRGRFLVPQGIADGWYHVRVVIENRSGTQTMDLPYHLDASALDFEVSVPTHAFLPGETFTISADTIEPAKEVTVYSEAFGQDQLPLLSTDQVRWSLDLTLPIDLPAGEYAVVVVARDPAGNRSEQRRTLLVGPLTSKNVAAPRLKWTSITNTEDVRDLALLGDGTLFAATAGGLELFGSRNRTLHVEDGLPSHELWALRVIGDRVYVATSRGLAVWQDGAVRSLGSGRPWHGLPEETSDFEATLLDLERTVPQGVIIAAHARSADLRATATADGQLWVERGGQRRVYQLQGRPLAIRIVENTVLVASTEVLLRVHGDGRLQQVPATGPLAARASKNEIVVADASGNLWRFSIHGLASENVRLAPGVSTFTLDLIHHGSAERGVFRGPKRLTRTDQICGNHLTSLTHDGHRWLAGTFDRGACISNDARRWTRIARPALPSDQINDVAFSGGATWIATSHGIGKRSGKNFEQLGFGGKNPLGLESLSVLAVLPQNDGNTLVLDRKGASLVAANGQLVSRERGFAGRAEHFTVAASAGDYFWIGSEDRGLFRFDGHTWLNFHDGRELPDNWVTALDARPDGTVAVGTCQHGIALLRPGQPSLRISKSAGLPDPMVTSVAFAGNTLWVGTLQGLAAVQDDHVVDTYGPGEGLADPRISLVKVIGDTLWIGTEAGTSFAQPIGGMFR